MKILACFSKPTTSGLIGLSGVGLFMVTIIILNFITPNYSLLFNTVSALALGQYGSVYTLSMLFYAFTTFVSGFGLSFNLTKRYISRVSAFFLAFALGVLVIALFKTDAILDQGMLSQSEVSLEGQIHTLATIVALFIFPLGLNLLIKQMKQSKYWQKLVYYCQFVLISSFVGGCLWFLAYYFHFGFAWKGIFQKMIIFDLLIWHLTINYFLLKSKNNDY